MVKRDHQGIHKNLIYRKDTKTQRFTNIKILNSIFQTSRDYEIQFFKCEQKYETKLFQNAGTGQ